MLFIPVPLLQQWLDTSLDSPNSLSRPKKRHFTDPDVCKYYICGFCPCEEFRRTKNDCGECTAIHDEACKAEWDALDEDEKDRYPFERDLIRRMERCLNDLHRRINANTQRLQASQKPAYLAEDQASLEAMDKQIEKLLEKAQELGEQGDVDAAEAATKAADVVREKKTQLERAADARSGNNATRGLVQSVCPISGLIINDEESRLRDHHSGRNYNSWKKLHDVHEALKETLAKRAEAKRHRGSPAWGDYDDRDRGRGGYERPRDRDRDRDSYRRRRSRSRDRDSRRRSRSRSRDRYRDRRSDRERGGRERDYYRRKEEDGQKRERERERSPEEGEVQG